MSTYLGELSVFVSVCLPVCLLSRGWGGEDALLSQRRDEHPPRFVVACSLLHVGELFSTWRQLRFTSLYVTCFFALPAVAFVVGELASTSRMVRVGSSGSVNISVWGTPDRCVAAVAVWYGWGGGVMVVDNGVVGPGGFASSRVCGTPGRWAEAVAVVCGWAQAEGFQPAEGNPGVRVASSTDRLSPFPRCLFCNSSRDHS